MKQAIHFITIGVQNLEVMKTFYKEVFGWEQSNEDEGIAFFKVNGFILALFPVDELIKDIGENGLTAPKGFKGLTASINFRSEEEVDLEFKNLISKGAVPIKNPHKVFWGGYSGYIADIENNYWELAFNPFIEISEDGKIA
ncbi:MAG: VOC family protein [Spirosomataceae bacterium]